MRLPELGVKRPIFTLMVFIAILVLGLVSLVRLPIDLFPEVETPSVTVVTQWPGASVEDVEGRVTRVIENQLSIVNNLDEVTSRTREGVSAITCMFDWGTDLEEAANDIRDRVSVSRRYLLIPRRADHIQSQQFRDARLELCGYRKRVVGEALRHHRI